MRQILEALENIENEDNITQLTSVIEHLQSLKSDLKLYDREFDSLIDARGIDGALDFVKDSIEIEYDNYRWWFEILSEIDPEIETLIKEVNSELENLKTRLRVGLE
jgi:hypothetical protein